MFLIPKEFSHLMKSIQYQLDNKVHLKALLENQSMYNFPVICLFTIVCILYFMCIYILEGGR